ncbi:hypothetical protein WHT83_06990 [Aminobacter sp. P9b]|uniref:hypothetical protein n=1 Tax=Aminobacter TaxID=31988 RepID=UPI000D36543C|nr:hypothetical protein [Aminobacter niigataensis]AWC20790.1 hypothetical protein CO731_00231 [Aminobacter sp. MSH1]CAI2931538.1 conserved protein of unknown function [Aminobacter niigataensis]
MPSRRINKIATAKLATNIRGELATESNLRVLEALPAFQAEDDLPQKLRRLLDRLEAAERTQPHPKP